MFPADPPSATGALSSAGTWVTSLLAGEAAFAIATLSIALLGFLFLTGRMEWRRAAWSVAGVALLFGAPTIAAGLLAGEQAGPTVQSTSVPMQPKPPSALPPAQADPYAGASVPR